MTEIDPQVLEGILALLREAQGDWEFDGDIGPTPASWRTSVSSRWRSWCSRRWSSSSTGGCRFPQFFDEIGQRPVEERDVSVVELATFVCEHRQPNPLEV